MHVYLLRYKYMYILYRSQAVDSSITTLHSFYPSGYESSIINEYNSCCQQLPTLTTVTLQSAAQCMCNCKSVCVCVCIYTRLCRSFVHKQHFATVFLAHITRYMYIVMCVCVCVTECMYICIYN